MIRKLTLAVALAAGTLPFSAFGLGLGELSTQSALNQQFKGEIKLISVPRGELDGVKISLASPEHFDRAGVERPFFLSSLKFEALRKTNGDAIIKVTSSTPIREPYLDFLLSVNWPKGSLVKEYTVLLDPPTTTERRPTSISQATTRSTPARSVSKSRVVTDGQYGPVQANETAWAIADSLRPSGVTVEQMMMALLAVNPNAFISNNVNLLKQGAILRVPDRGEMLAVDAGRAARDFNSQYQAWIAGSSVPQAAGVSAAAESTGEAASSGAGAAAKDDDSNAQLRIATVKQGDTTGSGAADGKSAADLERDLMAAREEAESARQSEQEMRGEVSQLKQQMADMQRLLELKDEQLAQLQSNVAGSAVTADVEETVEAEPAADAGEAVDSESSADIGESTESMAGDDTGQTTTAEDDAEGADETGVAEEEQEQQAAQTTVETEPVLEEGPPSWIRDNVPAMIGLGVAALLGLGALLAYSRRNKYQDEQWTQTKREMEESMLVPDTQELESVLSEIVDADSMVNPADTSFLSEYSTEDLHALQEDTSETDPVAEADVYVAYGRYKQAEELLKTALIENPERADIKHKMLEIYFANQNKDAFFDLAQKMAADGLDQADRPAWEKVRVMAQDLDPSNALFGGESLMAETMGLSELAAELESEIGEDESQPTESIGLESMEIGGSQMGLDDDEAESLAQTEDVAIGPDEDTELQTEMQNASVLTEFADTEALDDELADLEGDLESLMANLDEGDDVIDESIQGIDEISDGFGEGGDTLAMTGDSESLGVSEFTEPTTEIEVETKLELAQAYIDMQDEEGAREILQEIVVEGNEEQIAKAKEMQKSLGA